MVHHSEDSLYDVLWQPVPVGTYPNRGPSPKRTAAGASTGPSSDANGTTAGAKSGGSATTATTGTGGATGTGTAASAAKPKPAPYRPPGSTGALSDMLRRETVPAGMFWILTP